MKGNDNSQHSALNSCTQQFNLSFLILAVEQVQFLYICDSFAPSI